MRNTIQKIHPWPIALPNRCPNKLTTSVGTFKLLVGTVNPYVGAYAALVGIPHPRVGTYDQPVGIHHPRVGTHDQPVGIHHPRVGTLAGYVGELALQVVKYNIFAIKLIVKTRFIASHVPGNKISLNTNF